MTLTAKDYYYHQLNKEQKKVYYAVKEGLLKMEESFQVLKLSSRELADIYFMVRMDCPGNILFCQIYIQILSGFYNG